MLYYFIQTKSMWTSNNGFYWTFSFVIVLFFFLQKIHIPPDRHKKMSTLLKDYQGSHINCSCVWAGEFQNVLCLYRKKKKTNSKNYLHAACTSTLESVCPALFLLDHRKQNHSQIIYSRKVIKCQA